MKLWWVAEAINICESKAVAQEHIVPFLILPPKVCMAQVFFPARESDMWTDIQRSGTRLLLVTLHWITINFLERNVC